jgi:hypothetical protein
MMPTTNDIAQFRFDAQIGSDDLPFIGLTPVGKNLDVITDARLSFDLRPGATIEQAEALASRLNELVVRTQYVRYHGGLG